MSCGPLNPLEIQSIRAVLFDAGGTLIHVDGARLCGAAGIEFSVDAFQRAESDATAQVRGWVLRHPNSTDAERLPLFLDTILRCIGLSAEEDRRRAAHRIREEHSRSNLWSRPGEGGTETLQALRDRGYRLGVISNADGRVRQLLTAAGLGTFLEVIIDSAEVGVEKPDPRIFRAATDRLGLPPEACAYVGDIYEIDVVGARAAGLVPILIGACPAPEPVTRVTDLPGLLDLLPRNLPSRDPLAD